MGPVSRYKKVRYRDAEEVPCHYCGASLTKKAATVDHKWPRSRGGTNAWANLCIACLKCNTTKGSMTEDEFRGRTPTLKEDFDRAIESQTWEWHARRLIERANRRRKPASGSS